MLSCACVIYFVLLIVYLCYIHSRQDVRTDNKHLTCKFLHLIGNQMRWLKYEMSLINMRIKLKSTQ